jgi:DNA primase
MAGYIPEDIVEKIKSDTDILDLIAEYVTLKKTGKDYTGLCPFHKEKTPSFSVVPDKGFYYCFGCGASGNAVNFIMRHENLDYPEALRFLAKRAGITIPEKVAFDQESHTTKLYKAVEFAESYFKKHLTNSAGYDYFKTRGVTTAAIEEFGLGYAPDSWDGLLKTIAKSKLTPEIFSEAGLLVRRENQTAGPNEYYDKFRNRVIFPIRNLSGRPIGFGGRVLSDQEGPKYLNSPETPIYHKGSVLFGLNHSKNFIRERNQAVIIEGYFDFISVYQAGIKNIVAVSGTGFTPNQANLLARFCERVVLLYDADAAGMRATFRAVEVLFNAGLEPLIVRLPEGMDPDKYVRVNGASALRSLIDGAVNYLDFVAQSLPDKFARLPISRQEKLIESLVQTAAGLDDDLKHELFIRKAIEIFDLPPAASAKFERPKKRRVNLEPPEAFGRIRFEGAFLGFLIANPNYINESFKVIQPEHFSEPAHMEIYKKLKEWSFQETNIGGFLDKFPDEDIRRKLTEIIVRESAGAPPEARFDEFASKFREFHISDQLSALRQEIARAEKEGQTEKLERLTRAYRDLQNTAKRKAG